MRKGIDYGHLECGLSNYLRLMWKLFDDDAQPMREDQVKYIGLESLLNRLLVVVGEDVVVEHESVLGIVEPVAEWSIDLMVIAETVVL